jgi:hypothetical protein
MPSPVNPVGVPPVPPTVWSTIPAECDLVPLVSPSFLSRALSPDVPPPRGA